MLAAGKRKTAAIAVDSLTGTTGSTTVTVDPAARGLADSSGDFVGLGIMPQRARLAWAVGLSGPQAVTLRYHPPHPPSESCYFGLDFSAIIPFGGGIKSGTLAIQTNTAVPADASSSWTIGPVSVFGRTLLALLSGGVPGVDYRLTWTAFDAAGAIWPRTVLCLCGATS